MRSRMRLPVVVVVALSMIAGLVLVSPAIGAQSFGQPTPGQHIYDRAGVLTAAEMADLEARAQEVAAAGAPVVVYLQAQNASNDQTYNDAVDLMNAWDVESSQGAHDGLVFFFNLKPDNLHHGQGVIYAGAKHFDGGNLPKSELDRIFNHVMKPELANGNLAQGIADGLDAAASSLRNGPPPPPPPSTTERIAADVSRGPISALNVLAVVLSAGFAWFTRKVWRTQPRAAAPIAATTTPPDSTPPAIVGAVVSGKVRDSQLEATILDLAHRGALVIESEGKRHVQVRLLDASVPKTDFEHQVWNSLEQRAESDGVVTQSNLGRARSNWSGARKALEKQLLDAGLFDPRTSIRRRPVYMAAGVMLVVTALAVVIAAVGAQAWGVVGAMLLFVSGLSGLIAMSAYPNTTLSGAGLAADWQSYIAGIKQSKKDRTLDVALDLDAAMPYAVAAGASSSLDRRLKEAAGQGYAPAWLGPALYRNGNAANAFVCWTAFHSAVTPASSGSSGGGGAAAGGGGAGGSF